MFVAYELTGSEKVCVASQLGRAMVFSSDEVPVLRAAGKGVTGIKLRPEDAVMACELGVSSLDGPLVITGQGPRTRGTRA